MMAAAAAAAAGSGCGTVILVYHNGNKIGSDVELVLDVNRCPKRVLDSGQDIKLSCMRTSIPKES